MFPSEEEQKIGIEAPSSVKNYDNVLGKTIYLERDKPFIVTEIKPDYSEFGVLDTSTYVPITRLMRKKEFDFFAEYNKLNAHLFETTEKTERIAEATRVADEQSEQADIYSTLDEIFQESRDSELYKKLKDSNFDERIDAILDGNFELADKLEQESKNRVGDQPETQSQPKHNFRITDDNLGVGGAKTKYNFNATAIKLLKQIETESRSATPEEQQVLSKYVGWGGIPQAFDKDKSDWSKEYEELKSLLTDEEYESARASTLNAHYTSPAVIKAIYKTIENMGFSKGNILEPSMGVGNFFGLLPENMSESKLYGVELDGVTGRMAKQLYQNANITVSGYEKTTFPDNFFDVAVGNVPFGDYKLQDGRYDKHNFRIHDYFFAKTLDQTRPGGVVAFVTSKGTLDKANPEVRKHLAQRAELLGAVRLPNNAFMANAGTEVTTDIIFLQKRERQIDIEPDWVHLDRTQDGVPVNSYFTENPNMILGKMVMEKSMYGGEKETSCIPNGDLGNLATQLETALSNIHGRIVEQEREKSEGKKIVSIPADPSACGLSASVHQ